MSGPTQGCLASSFSHMVGNLSIAQHGAKGISICEYCDIGAFQEKKTKTKIMHIMHIMQEAGLAHNVFAFSEDYLRRFSVLEQQVSRPALGGCFIFHVLFFFSFCEEAFCFLMRFISLSTGLDF